MFGPAVWATMLTRASRRPRKRTPPRWSRSERRHVSLPAPGGPGVGTSGVRRDVTWFYSGFTSRLVGSGKRGPSGLDGSPG